MIEISQELLRKVSKEAAASQRRRTNYNFHKTYGAVVQRLLNAVEPGTYVQPHKHENPDKVEIFIILKGRALIVEFDSKGKITGHLILGEKSGSRAVEIPPRTWHTLISLRPKTVLYEVKEGPYSKLSDKNFAPWSPKEGSPGTREYIKKMLKKLNIKEER